MSVPLHGANPHRLYKHYGITPPNTLIDFSTNTNVFTRSYALEIDQSDIGPYPDPECSSLKCLLCNNQGIKANELLITNGANEGIYLLASLYAGKRVAILQPTYPEYEKALKAYDCQVVYETSVEALNQYEVAIICNPNNPTGQYYNLKGKMSSKTTYIIDESYIEFMTEPYQALEAAKNIYVVRSFTKIYKMAGLRGGYVVSTKENISQLKSRQPTWSVNALVQTLVMKYLEDDTYIEETQAFYKKEKDYLISSLTSLGYEIRPSSVNFFVMFVDKDDQLIQYLLKRGLIIRHTKNHIGLDGGYVRIAVRSREDNNQLIDALRGYKNESILS